MMTCDIAHDRLLALADPTRPQADLAAHLAGCDLCIRYQARLLTLADDLRALPAPESELAKIAFAQQLTAIGPVITSLPSRTRSPFVRWRELARPVGGLAAAVAVGVGLWSVIPGKKLPGPEPEFARHELLKKVVSLDAELARMTDPKARIPKLTEMAEAVRIESRDVHPAARDKDQMRSLAGMYRKVVMEGIVAQANKIDRFDLVAERQAVLRGTADQLAAAAAESKRLAASPGAPPSAKESLEDMAQTAETGRKELLLLAEGRANP